MPDTSDLRAAASLGGRGVAATTSMLRDVQLAIARRAFGATGPAGRPARLMHDGITQVVYAAVGGGARVAAAAAGVAVAARAATDPAYRPLAQRPRGNVAISALNGAWGDLLARTGNPLALDMSVRVDGSDVPVDSDRLADAFPGATGDVAVFVHGLCESDASWRLSGERHYGDAGSSHGSRLQAETGLTPVYVRYNSGLHISDNGAQLDELLTSLVEQWPVPVTRLTLVGHSMGGLVIRSACCAAQQASARWSPYVKRVVYLGSPHLGAPLEVGAAHAARALQKLPETRPIARALASRSVGIKDLRFGDVLVPFHSASGEGRARRLGLEVDRGRHLAGLHHFDLLNHPRVYAVLREWLAS